VLTRTALFLVLITGGTAIAAQYQPADFGKYQARFVESIRFPQGSGPVDIMLKCRAVIPRRGTLQGSHCDDHELYPQYHDAVVQKRRHLKFRVEPGRVSNAATVVYFQYMVRFQRDDDGERITVSPNHGNVEITTGFTTPQRYKSGIREFGRRCDRFYDGWVSGLILADGTARDVRAESGDLTPECLDDIVAWFETSKYIPALIDGEPVEMRLSERFWRQPGREGQRAHNLLEMMSR
jgi:hypothetical protein